MDLPLTAFEIRGNDNEYIKLEILEVYEFPDITSVYGGYDVKCRLEIVCGNYRLETDCCYSSTGVLYRFYKALNACYESLNGECKYDGCCDGTDLTFGVLFNEGKVTVCGNYQDDPARDTFLHFEFSSDQSYFSSVLRDLKKIVSYFGDDKGAVIK